MESQGIKEDGGASLFPHQVVDFALAHSASSHFSTFIFCIHTCTYIACILAAPTHRLYHTVALDSESEARYVRCQSCGRGPGIYLPAACCPGTCGGMPGLDLTFNKEEVILANAPT